MIQQQPNAGRRSGNFRNSSPLTTSAVLGIMLFAGIASGLQIRAYNPARHNRFVSGYPTNPVANTNFFKSYYDFSGVGWHSTAPYLSYTLISPKHFVGANHVKPGIGTALKFQGRDGVVRTYTVANQYNITNASGEHTDLFIGELTQSIPTCDHITFYPILNLLTEANYIGRPLLIYGHDARLGIGSINSILTFGGDPITGGGGINDTRAFDYTYVNATGNIDDCHLEGGDSGSPSFVAMNGEMFVVGVHLAVATTALAKDNLDTFVPNYLSQIAAIIQQQGYAPATSAAEVFRVCYDVTPAAVNTVNVSWVGHRGRVYQLHAATNLFNFSPISGSITAQTATVTFTDSNAVQAVKFYRVRRMD